MRRWWLVIVPLVIAALAWLGRPTPVAVASAAASSSSPMASGSASSSEPDATPLADAGADGDAETDADAALALSLLPDGGLVVDLNRATESDLRRLSGIGPGRAKAILALRDKLGRFKAVDDLLRIKGFGKATLRRLRPNLRV